jgi:Tfp pilus assembly protein PilX
MRNNQRGASIYFALDILAIMMAIVVGISTVIVIQLSNLKESGDSVVAFYAADAGIERALYDNKILGTGPGDPSINDYVDDTKTIASYEATIIATTTPGCDTSNAKYYCITSIGKYESSDTRRGIQINR